MKTSFSKRECNVCGELAVIWYKNKWWCAFCTSMGKFNIKGYCKHEKTDDNDPS
jgi:hypothetical protein